MNISFRCQPKPRVKVSRVGTGDATTEPGGPQRLDRRARRRQETIEEILDISEAVMTEEGVNGLSISEVARRLGVQPPFASHASESVQASPSVQPVFSSRFSNLHCATFNWLQALNTQFFAPNGQTLAPSG